MLFVKEEPERGQYSWASWGYVARWGYIGIGMSEFEGEKEGDRTSFPSGPGAS